MIFFNQRTIIFINKNTIYWANGRVPSGKFLSAIKKIAWSKENLRLAITDIVASFPKKLRIVVGEEFSYMTLLKSEKKKDSIVVEAQNIIPEKLTDAWDSANGDAGMVQVMAVQQNFFADLKKFINPYLGA